MSVTAKRLGEIWNQLAPDAREADLENQFVTPLLSVLELEPSQVKKEPTIGSGLRPDYLIYRGNQPFLVIESKKRVPALGQTPEARFELECHCHPIYKKALGTTEDNSENGIKQYLDNGDKVIEREITKKIDPDKLAQYGLVVGDFFQLWRRVDGLIYPITPIQKVLPANIPKFIKQLKEIFDTPHRGLVNLFWNQKGGVGKTTNTLNIAATLAIKGKRVLLIDLDPQADLTRSIGFENNKVDNWLVPVLDKVSLKDKDATLSILKDSILSKSLFTDSKQSFRLDILPNPNKFKEFLDGEDDGGVNAYGNRIFPLLKETLSYLQLVYDYIFIDMSPTPNRLTAPVIFSTDLIATAVEYGKKSLEHGIQIYQNHIPRLRQERIKSNPLFIGPWNVGFVFSKVSPNQSSSVDLVIDQFLTSKGFTGKQCNTKLQTYAQVMAAELSQVPVVRWQNSPITKLYRQLVNEIYLESNFINH